MMSTALRTKYDFRWEVLEIIIGGRSPIDVNEGSFSVKSLEEAQRFMASYGYDVDKPIELAEVQGNFREALSFIKKYFLFPDQPQGLKLEIPRKIIELENPLNLLLMASLHYPDQTADHAGIYLRDWACAVLKVMHTITHVDKDLRSPYFADIQQQILDRFYKVVHREEDGHLYLGQVDDPLRVRLVAFETKPKKTRESVILKLLHKRENVAEELFDRVGIRFVTETPLEALRAIKFLKENMIIMWPNIKSSRSRNTLMDIDRFRTKLDQLFERLDKNEDILETEFSQQLTKVIDAPFGGSDSSENPHSSEYYRSVQFTSRQLIKLRNSVYDELKEIKGYAKKENTDPELLARLDRIDLKYLQKEIRFFYPYEIQLMDKRSYEENEKGQSAHSEYKRSQVLTALRRVMGNLVDASRQ